jgi:restriction system protein
MPKAWMIRAGEGGYLAEKFAKGYVAIGWHDLGDLTKVQTADEIREKYLATWLEDKKAKGAANNDIAMIYKFRHEIKVGDWVVTYNREKREYLLGKITSDYLFNPELVDSDFPHVRKVKWEHHIGRDALQPASKNSFGIATLVSVREDVLADMLEVAGKPVDSLPQTDDESEGEEKKILFEDAQERIKDKIVKLSEDELPQLVAAILRAMGLKTRISPKGADRGRDILASPDGLGFQEPRIKVEVKHKPNTAIGAPDIRSFITTLRERDKGLYASSGGFTKEAKYEAERAPVPVELVDLDGLANLVFEHYSKFDLEGQTLLPLVRIYWPSE